MFRRRPSAFIAAVCVFAYGCGSDISVPKAPTDTTNNESPDASAGAESPERMEIPLGTTVGDLTDGQIETICGDVEPVGDMRCGTDSDGQEIVADSPFTAQDCRDAVSEMRDGAEACVLATEVERFWSLDPCDRVFEPALTCPDFARCMTLSVEECGDFPDTCAVHDGLRWDPDAECYEERGAYCFPRNANCDNGTYTATGRDGACWWLSSGCYGMKGWEYHSSSEQQCPYSAMPRCGEAADPAACHELSVGDCETAAGCEVRVGSRLSLDGTCQDRLPAFCAPTQTCNDIGVAAKSPKDRCWQFGGDCGLPPDWEYQGFDGERSCAFDEDLPDCD